MRKLICILLTLLSMTACLMAVERPRSPSSSKSSKSSSSSSSNDLCDEISELLLYLSFYNNIYANFDNYPYATRKNYIGLDTDLSVPQWYRFTFNTDVFYVPEFNNMGTNMRFEGYAWKFFGPVFENRLITSFDNTIKQGDMNLGLQFSIFQLSLCTFVFDIKWQYLYGDYTAHGLNLGIGFRSYPIKPLVIEYRADWGNFKDSASETNKYTGIRRNATFRSHLEAGCMLNSPAEVYGFWDYIMDGFHERKEHSLGVGLKYHL